MPADGDLYRRHVTAGGRVYYVRVAERDPDGWFPITGLWLVEEVRGSRSMRCIRHARLGDLPDPLPLASLERHRDTLVKAMDECHKRWQTTPMSLNEVADAIFAAIAAKLEKLEKEKEE